MAVLSHTNSNHNQKHKNFNCGLNVKLEKCNCTAEKKTGKKKVGQESFWNNIVTPRTKIGYPPLPLNTARNQAVT